MIEARTRTDLAAVEIRAARAPGADPVLWVLAGVLTLIGWLVIFNAGFAESIGDGRGPIPGELRSQVLATLVSLAAAAAVYRIRGERWMRLAWPVFLAALGLVLAVKFVGIEIGGARRWLDFKITTFQPSEMMKVGVILLTAAVMANRSAWREPRRIRDWADRMDKVVVPRILRLWPAAVVGLAIFAVEREPDLGTAAVIAFFAWVMFMVGGIQRRTGWLITALSLALVWGVVSLESYRLERIHNHVHRWESDRIDDVGFQTVTSEIGMASGGLMGTGLGAGRVKQVMPVATSDFVMATVAEEAGFVGVVLILGLTGWLSLGIWRLGMRSPHPFAQLVCVGVASWLSIQAAVNLMMANGTLPPIGIPFPFISAGGTSILMLWIAIAICQSAGRMEVQKEVAVASGDHRWRDRRARVSRPRSR